MMATAVTGTIDHSQTTSHDPPTLLSYVHGYRSVTVSPDTKPPWEQIQNQRPSPTPKGYSKESYLKPDAALAEAEPKVGR